MKPEPLECWEEEGIFEEGIFEGKKTKNCRGQRLLEELAQSRAEQSGEDSERPETLLTSQPLLY